MYFFYKSVHYITFYKSNIFSSSQSQYFLFKCQIKINHEFVKLVKEKKTNNNKKI